MRVSWIEMSLGATTWIAGALMGSIPWRWLPSFDVAPVVRQVSPVSAATASAPAPRPIQLADEVILRALDPGRTAFLRCWKRALDADPLLDATKVRLRLELDASGTVTGVTHDAPSTKLGNCLSGVVRSLPFAAPGVPAVADVPLFFQHP